jgi:hypothetical protein
MLDSGEQMTLNTYGLRIALALVACSTTTQGCDADGGSGTSGPCPSGQVPSQQIVVTETTCDLSGPATQCAEVCDADCEEGKFQLGAAGSGCARTPDGGELCRCVCAECRLE